MSNLEKSQANSLFIVRSMIFPAVNRETGIVAKI